MGDRMNDESHFQFERYLQVINRRKYVLVIPVVLALVAAAVVSYLMQPTYSASATARVDLSAQPTGNQDIGPADRYINTYAAIIKANGFLDRVISDLGLHTTAADLKSRVATKRITNTELVQVTASAHSADEAAAIANRLTDLLRDPAFVAQFVPDIGAEYKDQIESQQRLLADQQSALANLKLSPNATAADVARQQAIVDSTAGIVDNLIKQQSDALVRQAQAARGFAVIEPAAVPGAPDSPRWLYNLAAGLLAGVIAGVALALVLEYIDPTLRGVRDLEGVTRLPVLASIPFGIRWRYPPQPVSPDYRLLATKLITALQEKDYSSVLFTSARPEEGNTTIATYTAMAVAQAGVRVLLLDANLSQPDLHKLFNFPVGPGLFNFISSNGARPTKPMPAAVTDIVHHSPVPRLDVMTAGTKMSDPSELLASAEMREFLDYLETHWDVVVIDGASLHASAGSAVIAPVVDGVVVVAAEGQASRRSVEESLTELESLGAHPLGLVYSKSTEG